MTTVGDLFDARPARSAPFDDHDVGELPFVTNGYRNNGVIGYVTALPEDRVFQATSICISAFCETTVQRGPFIARGNGGSGLTVLQPKEPMSEAQLWACAGYLGRRHRWKFSFGRMATAARIEPLDLSTDAIPVPNFSPELLLPKRTRRTNQNSERLRYVKRRVSELFYVSSGDFHSTEELTPGGVPLISCGDQDNGIIGFYAAPADKTYDHALTVAYNGDWPLMAKFHPYMFAAKDDVAVLSPRVPMALSSLLFLQMLLNRETWRHSYGRKLYKARLEKFELNVPVDDGGRIDDAKIATWLKSNPLWSELSRALEHGLPNLRQETLALMADSGG
jgi:hypothetical protein